MFSFKIKSDQQFKIKNIQSGSKIYNYRQIGSKIYGSKICNTDQKYAKYADTKIANTDQKYAIANQY